MSRFISSSADRKEISNHKGTLASTIRLVAFILLLPPKVKKSQTKP